jgi:hypothetical protein
MNSKSILTMVTGGVFSLLMLSGCNQSDTTGPASVNAKVVGKAIIVAADTNAPADTAKPWCGTPDPEGTDPMDIPHTTDHPVVVDIPTTPDPKPEVVGEFEPIDWTAKAIAGSEGWHCSSLSPPVCATNGKSYRNGCEAAWSGFRVASEGKCKL